MADDILISFITSSLRSKSQDDSALKASQILYQASKSLSIFDSSSKYSNELNDICAKAKSLTQSKNSTHKIAGLLILRSFASEASCATFLQGFLEWFNEAISILKSPPTSLDQHHTIVHNHAWQLLNSIFSRAGRIIHIPGIRRDASTLIPKLINLLKAAHEDPTMPPSLDAPMISTLYAALISFPASFKQHVKTLEPILIHRMYTLAPGGIIAIPASTRDGDDAPLLAASCYAVLSRAEGDADSWSTRLHNLLATIHSLLDIAYLGLEPPHFTHRACRASYKPDARCIIITSDTGYVTDLSALSQSMDGHSTSLSYIHTTVHCLISTITTSHPFPVPLPIQSLIALSERMLSVDAEALTGGGASAGRLTQLLLCLAELRCHAVTLLETVFRVGSASAIPYVGRASRIAHQLVQRIHHSKQQYQGEKIERKRSEDNRKSSSQQQQQQKNRHQAYPERHSTNQAHDGVAVSIVERRAMYDMISRLVQVGGMSVVKIVGQAVILCGNTELFHQVTTTLIDPGNNAITLYHPTGGGKPVAMHSHASITTNAAAGSIPSPSLSPFLYYDARATHIGADSHIAALTSQAAFLSCIESLLVHGATFFSVKQRAVLDQLIARTACAIHTTACKARHDPDGDVSLINTVHCAAYKALLASVLAPALHRPRYISLAMKLFNQDMHHPDKEIAMFCSHALLCCESLMHPRSVPVILKGNAPGSSSSTHARGDDQLDDIDAMLMAHIRAIPRCSTIVDPGEDVKRAVVIAIEEVYQVGEDDAKGDGSRKKRKTTVGDYDDDDDRGGGGGVNEKEREKEKALPIIEQKSQKERKKRREDEDASVVAAAPMGSFEERARKALAAIQASSKEESQHPGTTAVAPVPQLGVDDVDGSESDISLPDIDSGDEDE